MPNCLRRLLGGLSVTLGLLVPAPASAHDPFEITTDAHLEQYGLGLHTTLSLDSAARICLTSAAPARRFAVGEFPQFRAQFERCAREFFALSVADERLPVRSLSLQLSPEDDLEMRVIYDRPSKSPLAFETSTLNGLPSGAGIVLTVTGRRSFLGQKVLRPDDARFECSITTEGESVGGAPQASSEPVAPSGEHTSGIRFLDVVLAVAVLTMGAILALRSRR
ncbi:MAG TPA: hypothetical protein VER96_12620 [Polyangiaceae bacterium]|nr:hypothetical protein [Polyangiaceae bacterium]